MDIEVRPHSPLKAAYRKDVVCPSCGNFVRSLIEETGWCRKCTGEYTTIRFEHAKLEVWLSQNADHLEFYLSQGRSLYESIDLLRESIKPICLCCGAVIKRAPRRTVIFCRKTPKCRQLSRRYVYRYTNMGMTKAEALASIMKEL